MTRSTKTTTSRNAAIAEAIHEAYRAHAYERMHRETEALRDNPGYQAEIKAVREAMGPGDAW